jgi:hypothetical protein
MTTENTVASTTENTVVPSNVSSDVSNASSVVSTSNVDPNTAEKKEKEQVQINLEVGHQIQLLTLLTHPSSSLSNRKEVTKNFTPNGEVYVAFDFEATTLLNGAGVTSKTLGMLGTNSIFYWNFLPNDKYEVSATNGFQTRCAQCGKKCQVGVPNEKTFYVKTNLCIKQDETILYALRLAQFVCSQKCYNEVEKMDKKA